MPKNEIFLTLCLKYIPYSKKNTKKCSITSIHYVKINYLNRNALFETHYEYRAIVMPEHS